MIKFTPNTITEHQFAYTAADIDQHVTASCHCALEPNTVTITAIECPLQREDMREGLIRSALQYAANRNAYIAKARLPIAGEAVFLRLGFQPKDGMLQAEIPDVMLGCCGCN